jgi:hypothetical protein
METNLRDFSEDCGPFLLVGGGAVCSLYERLVLVGQCRPTLVLVRQLSKLLVAAHRLLVAAHRHFPHPGVEPKWCTQVNSLVAYSIYTDQSQLHVAVSCHRPPSQNPHQSFFHLRYGWTSSLPTARSLSF